MAFETISAFLGFNPVSALGASPTDVAQGQAQFESDYGEDVWAGSPAGTLPPEPSPIATPRGPLGRLASAAQGVAQRVASFLAPESGGGVPLPISLGLGALSFVGAPIAAGAAATSLFFRGATALGGESRGAGAPFVSLAPDEPEAPELQEGPSAMPFHEPLLRDISATLGTVGDIVSSTRQIFGTSTGPATASAYLSPGVFYPAGGATNVRLGAGQALALGAAGMTAASRALAFLRTKGFNLKRFKQLVALVGLTAAAEILSLSLQDAAILATKRTRRRRGISAASLATTRRTLRQFKSLDKQLTDACKRPTRRR